MAGRTLNEQQTSVGTVRHLCAGITGCALMVHGLNLTFYSVEVCLLFRIVAICLWDLAV